MKQKFIALFIIISCISGIFISVNAEEVNNIYVSVNGNDQNPGTEELPLKSLEGAKNFLRKRTRKDIPVNVIFEEGEYFIEKSVEFTRIDSGTSTAPIVYKAKDGAKVEFIGSKRLDVSKFEIVTDEEILSRVYPEVRGKLMQLDLKEQNIPKELYDWTKSMREIADRWIMTPLPLFLNGKVQQVSRWPNSGRILIDSIVETGNSYVENTYSKQDESVYKKGAKITYVDSEPSRWEKADNAFLRGYFSNPWYRQDVKLRSVDTENMTMQLDSWLSGTISKTYSTNGYYVFHLLEEIDIPGEWYIEKDTGILYYYPPEDFSEDDVFEIGYTEEDMVTMDNTSYVTFENLGWSKNTQVWGGRPWSHANHEGANALVMNDCAYITVKDCKFHDIAEIAIDFKGENIVIDGCEIYNIGNCGIMGYGGEYDGLVSCKNVIKNCHIAGTIQHVAQNTCAAIYIGPKNGNDDNVNFVVENNVIHNTPNTGIYYKGVQHEIKYNEIYNNQNTSSDGGAIYTGRSWGQFGTEVSNNYIHDVGMQHDTWHTCGIYYDDSHSGNIFKNNIVVLNNTYESTGVFINGGSHNHIEGNTVVNGESFVLAGTITMTPNETVLDGLYSVPFRSSEFVKAFPTQLPMVNEYLENGKVNVNNTYINNLMMNAPPKIGQEPYKSDISYNGNVNISEYSDEIFVDAKNQDFRVTDEAKEKYNISEAVLGEDFDINLIGIQNGYEIPEELKNFNLTGPYDKTDGVDASEVHLAWEDSVFVDEYDYYVATDPEMKNIVASGTTKANNADVTGLENSKTYYWTVKGRIMSRQYAEVIDADNIFEFTTAEKSSVDTLRLNFLINEANKKYDKITEGIEPGKYKEGTKHEFSAVINDALKYADMTYGDQAVINQKADELNNAINNLVMKINAGYQTIGLTENSDWGENSDKFIREEGITTIQDTAGTVVLRDRLPTYNVLCFSFMAENCPGWYAVGIRHQDVNKAIWGDNSYYLAIKPNVIEIQRKGKILKEIDNNGFVNQGEWNDIECGAINVSEGVFSFIKLNGEVIYSEIDTEGVHAQDGMVMAYLQTGGKLSIRDSENVSGELFDLSEYIDLENSSENIAFSDLKGYEWAEEAILYLSEKGIVNGIEENEFAPNRNLTREQAAKIISLAFNCYNENAECGFSDVEKMSWAYRYVASCYEREFIKGISEDVFGSKNELLRQDAALILYRILVMSGREFKVKNESFTDWEEISDYAKEAVSYISGEGIINGFPDGSFKAKEPIKRAEMAKLIYEMIKK